MIDTGRRTEVIRNVEPRRAMLSDRIEIRLTFSEFPRIYKAALREKYELIEKSYYIATRLMDCEDDGTIVVARKRNQTVDDIIGVVCVQACGITYEGVASLETIERTASGLVEE
jgi:hypothetical protein